MNPYEYRSDLLIVVVAYLLGCVASGYYLVRWRTGRDLRDAGSGGTGATNAGRVLGRAGFFATLSADFLKGGLAAAAGWWLGDGLESRLLAVLGVVAGHVWPGQLGFRGGKGVAPFLAALAVAAPRWLLAFGAVFAAAFLILRRFTVAGLTAVAVLPAAVAWTGVSLWAQGLLGATALLILIAHRRNLREEIAKFRPRLRGSAVPELSPSPPDEHRTPDRF